MAETILRFWPFFLAAAAATVWGLSLAYKIAQTVTRIEEKVGGHGVILLEQEKEVTDLHNRLHSIEVSCASRHGGKR